MRKRFEQQRVLGTIAIEDVEIDEKSRHELKYLVAGLKYIFTTPEINEAIFKLMEEAIIGDKKDTGRNGMTLWQILVLGAARLVMDLNYDALHDYANNHKRLRQIMGCTNDANFKDEGYFNLQTIKDNIALFNEDLLIKINEVVVKSGHKLLKKKDEEVLILKIKTDTYPVQANVHFPTDLNLLWDSGRKSIESVQELSSMVKIHSWRKSNDLLKKLKSSYRKASEIHRKKGSDYQARLKNAVTDYLAEARRIATRLTDTLCLFMDTDLEDKVKKVVDSLTYFHGMLLKHIDLVNRRILKEEKIPHSEKVFSVFETHVEWLQKGKANSPVEIGRNVLITTDQHHFILTHSILKKETDKEQPIALAEKIKKSYLEEGICKIESSSFDRGFYSSKNENAFKEICDQVVMPKPGKKTEARKKEEASATFVHLRKKHSAVESNINELEHCGLNRVPDRGEDGFKRYVALGILGYNIKRLGKVILEQSEKMPKVSPAQAKGT